MYILAYIQINEGKILIRKTPPNVRRGKENAMPDIEYMKRLAEQLEKGEINFLDENDEFVFACDQCGKCCRNRGDILLSPLDIYNLVRATGKSAMEIIERYGECYIGSNSNLPVIRLRFRMESDGTSACFFLGKRDGKYYCRVHEYKPTVCRTYPLGKISRCETKTGEDSGNAPQYFLQEAPPKGMCTGNDRAKSEQIRQKVIDWVGGPERKWCSDQYSQIFNQFTKKIAMKLKPEKLRKNPTLYSIYYASVSGLMYTDYDFTATSDQFLSKMAVNLEIILRLTDIAMNSPDTFLHWVKEERGKKGQVPNESA